MQGRRRPHQRRRVGRVRRRRRRGRGGRPTTGIRAGGRETVAATSSPTRWPSEGDETQTGFGFSVGRAPADLDVDEAADDAAERATRLLGRHQAADRAPHRRARPLRHRPVPRHRRRDAQRRGRAQGPLAVRRPARRGRRRRRCVTLVDDPTDVRAFTAADHRRRGPGHPPQRARRRRRARRLRAQRLHAPAGPARRRTGSAVRGGFKQHARRSAARPSSLLPGDRRPGRAARRRRRRRAGAGGLRAALGRQPGQRRLLHRRRGPAHPGRRAGRAGAGVHHRLHAPADAARRAWRSAPTSSGCR